MNLIFNDATSLQVQKVEVLGGSLRILAIGITSEQLRKNFSDSVKTKKMYTEERGQKSEPLEGYIEYDHTEEYPGNIYGIVMNQVGKSTEERLSTVEGDMKTAKKDIKDLQEGGTGEPESYAAVFAMAKMSAEEITNDEQALKVADLYDLWSGESVEYKIGKYLTYKEVLYKVLQDHTSQPDWPPDAAASLYAKVLIDPSGRILPWEQPDATNPYMKGDKVTHNEKIWESEADNNVWEPGATGVPWKEITE